jgi:hypothetical protein
MPVYDVIVTVNGGGVSARTHNGSLMGGDRSVFENSRVDSTERFGLRPSPDACKPLDIVEMRAVASLLASLRSQREPLPSSRVTYKVEQQVNGSWSTVEWGMSIDAAINMARECGDLYKTRVIDSDGNVTVS